MADEKEKDLSDLKDDWKKLTSDAAPVAIDEGLEVTMVDKIGKSVFWHRGLAAGEAKIGPNLENYTDDELLELHGCVARKRFERAQAALRSDPENHYNESPNKGPPQHVTTSPRKETVKKPVPTQAQLLEMLDFANERIKVLEGELAECRKIIDQVEERDLERRLRAE